MLLTILVEHGPFQTGKIWLGDITGLSKDVLHVCVGILVFAAVMVLARKGPYSWLPLIFVFAAAIIGEILDIWEIYSVYGYRWEHLHWRDHWHDLWVTSLIPVLMFLLARIARPLMLTD